MSIVRRLFGRSKQSKTPESDAIPEAAPARPLRSQEHGFSVEYVSASETSHWLYLEENTIAVFSTLHSARFELAWEISRFARYEAARIWHDDTPIESISYRDGFQIHKRMKEMASNTIRTEQQIVELVERCWNVQGAASTEGPNWYFAEDTERGLSQIVVLVDSQAASVSEFSNLVLNPSKYAPLLSELAVGFFQVDQRPGPGLLVKTPDFSREMAAEPITLGFTFCHMPLGPLFAVFVYSSTTRSKLATGCFIDQLYGLDDFERLVTSAFNQAELRVVFAHHNGMTGIECVCDRTVGLDEPLRNVFSREWTKLSVYCAQLSQISFEGSRQELYQRTPVMESPILPRPISGNESSADPG